MTTRSDVATEPVGSVGRRPAAEPPSLSIVMPVFNEERWVEPSVEAVVTAAANAGWPAEIVVVDDGSTDQTPRRLRGLAERYGVTVVSQDNRGRFAARLAGLRRATGDQVVLVDSRVIVEPDALVYLREQLLAHPERNVWNGHVDVVSDGNPYPAFWAALVKIGWRRYCGNPRLVSYGIEEFDSYPKGTTLFSAPTRVLLAATRSFSSMFTDRRLASDDTRLIRSIAEGQRIYLAPGFGCRYHGRDSLRKFAGNAYYRGTTFVDGYAGRPGPVRRAAVALACAGIGWLWLMWRRRRTAVLVAASVPAVGGIVLRRCGATPGEVRAVARLLPVFVAYFGAGVFRGLLMAARSALRR